MDLDDIPESPMLPPLHPLAAQRLRQILAATSVSLGAMCAGTCLAWTSPALSQLSAADAPFRLSAAEEAIIGGIIAVGALLTAIPIGLLADRFGRKPTTLALAAFFLLNWLLIIFASGPGWIIAGRALAGVGTGGACVVIPAYNAEIAEPAFRATLGVFLNLFLTIGILVSAVFGSFTSWRVLSVILAVIPVVFGASFAFMPESPAFLVKTGKEDAAEATMRALRGPGYDFSMEMAEIRREVAESKLKSLGIRDIFERRAYRNAFCSVVAVLAFQQLSGINVVVFYTVPIFKAAGSGLSPELSAIIIALVQVVASNLSVFIVEKANRKFYLLLSSSGMLVCLMALGMFFHLKRIDYNVASLGFIPICAAVLFMVFFSVGYGPVPWLLMGELYAPEIKGIGNGVAISTNWGCAFLVTYLFPIVNAAVGAHVAFYGCGVIMAAATLFVLFVVPETRGKTLLAIQQLLNN